MSLMIGEEFQLLNVVEATLTPKFQGQENL
jgi:hypothetical protein